MTAVLCVEAVSARVPSSAKSANRRDQVGATAEAAATALGDAITGHDTSTSVDDSLTPASRAAPTSSMVWPASIAGREEVHDATAARAFLRSDLGVIEAIVGYVTLRQPYAAPNIRAFHIYGGNPAHLRLEPPRDAGSFVVTRLSKSEATQRWATCSSGDCIGVRFGESTYCVKHAPPEVAAVALAQLASGEPCSWTRGLDIDAELMDAIARAVPVDGDGCRTLPGMDFMNARFLDSAQFSNCIFSGQANFQQCVFEKGAEYGAAEFRGGCSFAGSRFHGRLFLKQAVIAVQGDFSDIACSGEVAGFNIRSAPTLRIERSQFLAPVVIAGDCHAVTLDECTFGGKVSFHHLTTATCSLRDATFEAPTEGYLRAERGIDLRRARIASDFNVALHSPVIRMANARYSSAARIEFLGDLELDEARFEAATLITRVSDEVGQSLGIADPKSTSARILSIRLADVRQLTIADVDLSVCRFQGAHGLDVMKIEPAASGDAHRESCRPREGSSLMRCYLEGASAGGETSRPRSAALMRVQPLRLGPRDQRRIQHTIRATSRVCIALCVSGARTTEIAG